MHSDSERKSVTVLFLRHGQTDYPKDRYYNDAIEDPALNQTGRHQANQWPGYFDKNPRAITAVYVSPSRRTQETAKIAAEGLAVPCETVDGLQEWRFGRWGGLTTPEIKIKYQEEWNAWHEDTAHFTPSGGESLSGFSKRVNEIITDLVSRHSGQTVLVVTHAGVIRMIVSAALEMPLVNFKRLVIAHGSITEIEYTDRWPNLHAFSFIPEILNEEM